MSMFTMKHHNCPTCRCTEPVKPIDIQEATKTWVDYVINRYKDYDRNDLTQVYFKGYFAGMSEREVFELAERLNDNAVRFPRVVG